MPRLLAWQPLLRDGSALGHRMENVRQYATGTPTGAGYLRFRTQPYRVQLRARAADQDGVGSLSGAPGRMPRLCASGRHVVPRDEYSGALLHGLYQRRRHATTVYVDGFRRMVRGFYWRKLADVRC